MKYQIIEVDSTAKLLIHDVDYSSINDLNEEVKSSGFDTTALESITNTKRKAEWLSVRKLLKTQYSEAIDIIYNDQNKPFIKNSDYALSISHSFERIAIYLKESDPIGVDLQKITDKIHRIKHKFLSHKEQTELSLRENELLTIYWSLKEASFKAYGINNIYLKDNIHILKFDIGKGEAVCKVQKDFYDIILNLRFEVRDDYALAYVVNS